jgi:hypothetical protein
LAFLYLELQVHFVIGIIILVWIILQLLFGFINKYLQRSKYISPKIVSMSRIIHKYSGYVMVLLCKTECIIGWKVYLSALGFKLIIIEVAISLSIISFLIIF